MLTFEKSRYAAGDKLELLSRGAKPPPRSFSTSNAWFITSIATRLAQTGFYTKAEEDQEEAKEREMVHPSFKYGAMVNLDARPDPETLDQDKRDQIKAFRTCRDMSIYGESSVRSALTSLSSFMREPASPDFISPDPEPKQKVSRMTESKEKITSNLNVLGDSGSVWSDVSTDTSMATTTATYKSSIKSITPLRQRLNQRLAAKGKMQSMLIPDENSSSTLEPEEMEEIESGGSSSIDLMNEAALDHMVDETLDEALESARKRPKQLLLGKILPYYCKCHNL